MRLSIAEDKLARRSRVAARAMLAVYVLWQLGAVLHLVNDDHSVLPDGRITETDPETGQPIPEDCDHDSNDGCHVLAQLTSAGVLVGPDAGELELAVGELKAPEFDVETPTIHGRELFRLAPSHSPPTLV